jgi:hypothetical protein
MIKLLNWILRLLTTVALLGGLSVAAQTLPSHGLIPPVPPPSYERPAFVAGIQNGALSFVPQLTQLKAVLLVGPIDGDNGDWTMREKQSMELAAIELEANGVEVHRFYTPNNDWEQIKVAAEDAHFLFYRGHGVYWSSMPHPEVGGFALSSRFVSSDDIRQDLRLAPNAIVMLYGCFTAGSSSIDVDSISSQEAQRRVAQYSEPFLDVGVAGYYADWFGDAFQMFVRYLFRGMTLGEAYEAYFDYNDFTVERYLHPDHPQTAMWLDKDDWEGVKYNNAFVGLPDRTLMDLFPAAEMRLSPTAVTFLAEPSFAARTFSFQVGSAAPGTFDWTAEVSPVDASWLAVRPLSGDSGQTGTVIITPTGKAPGIYQAYVRVTAEGYQIGGAEQGISVTLHVLDDVYETYLPAAFRGRP